MPARFAVMLLVLLPACVALAGEAAGARDPVPPGCDAFTWDVADELAALPVPGAAGVAGNGGDVAPTRIATGTRADIRLHPRNEVSLAAEPGKAQPGDAMAGLMVFQVPVDGRYRVSLATGHWVDVIDRGRVVASLDHRGQRGCPLLRKVVEFELEAGRDLLLQVVGGAGSGTAVLVTPAGVE